MAITPTSSSASGELQLRPAESQPRTDAADAPASGSIDFGSILAEGIDHANKLDAAASAKVEALAKGASDDLHGTMISAKEAEIAVKLVGSVRNRLLDAFHELWRIQL